MTERRQGTTTGYDIVSSFGDENVDRGEGLNTDFVKRRPTFPLGDNPRGREIFLTIAEAGDLDAYGAKNLIFRGYHGKAPLAGQDYQNPVRIGQLPRLPSLRPDKLFTLTVDTEGLDAAKIAERAQLDTTNFSAIYPTITITTPAPGATISRGSRIEIRAIVKAQRFIISSTLVIDGKVAEGRRLPRRDQEVSTEHEFIFIYDIPSDRSPGPMDITVHGFSIHTSLQGEISYPEFSAPSFPDYNQTGLGTLDGRLGQSDGSQNNPPLLPAVGLKRSPEAMASITVNIT